QIQAQREASINQGQALRRKRGELQATLSGLERHLANTPGVERDYTVMLRDLESAQSEYRLERLKQNEAQTAENLEVERKGRRFRCGGAAFSAQRAGQPDPPPDPDLWTGGRARTRSWNGRAARGDRRQRSRPPRPRAAAGDAAPGHDPGDADPGGPCRTSPP